MVKVHGIIQSCWRGYLAVALLPLLAPPALQRRALTHPLIDVQQTKHIVDPAAYAALVLELHQGGNHSIGDNEIIWAIEQVPAEVHAILLQMPPREVGTTRLENIMYKIDTGIRARTMLRGT